MEDKYNLLDKEKSTEEHYVIRHGVTEINEGAFRNHTKVTSIEIPNTVKYIGESAFSGCSNLSGRIDIPDSVTIINEQAFLSCICLEEINIPFSVQFIGDSAFGFCIKLKEINVDDENPKYTTVDGILYNKDKTVILSVPAGIKDTFSIPSFVNTIGVGAFLGCNSLTNVDIPDSITEISEFSFACCLSLTDIKIPQSVTSIGNQAFIKCDSLSFIEIPESIVFIGDGAFSSCNNLSEFVIPENVDYYYENGILFDKHKYKIVCVTSLNKCTYRIPDSVTEIGDHAFLGCNGLQNLIIPSNVNKIGFEAFGKCTDLKKIDIRIRRPQDIYINENAFKGCNIKDENFIIPIGSVYAYANHPVFSQFNSPD